MTTESPFEFEELYDEEESSEKGDFLLEHATLHKIMMEKLRERQTALKKKGKIVFRYKHYRDIYER